MTTFERVKKVLVDQLSVDPNLVTPDFSIRDQMDADSLDMVEIIICIEEEFDISIADEAARHMETVGDFVEHIDQQRAKHAKH